MDNYEYIQKNNNVLVGFLICFTFMFALSLTNGTGTPECQRASRDNFYIVYADMDNHSKPTKRIQIFDPFGNYAKSNIFNCSKESGNKREIELPEDYEEDFQKAINDEMANGAFLVDYLDIWIRSLNFLPEGWCISLVHREYEFKYNLTCNWDPALFKPNIFDKVIYGKPPKFYIGLPDKQTGEYKRTFGFSCSDIAHRGDGMFIARGHGQSISDYFYLDVTCDSIKYRSTIRVECQDCKGRRTHCPHPADRD